MAQSRKSVVIVDDDVEMGRAIARLVTAAGFAALVFTSGKALLEANLAADCFVIDLHMPGMSGLELALRIPDTGLRGPIIFITALDDPVSRERAREAGAAGFLIKPFEGELLLELVAKSIR